jgi:hypothetical protein
LAELKAKVQGAILSGLVRVDMMIYEDHLIVNEFESFEASFYSTDKGDVNGYEASTNVFLVNYWHSNITAALGIQGDCEESPTNPRKSNRTQIQTQVHITHRPPTLFVQRWCEFEYYCSFKNSCRHCFVNIICFYPVPPFFPKS